MISIRKRGQVYQYSFEISKVDGKRKRKSKAGFKTKKEAMEAGIIGYNNYFNNGFNTRNDKISYSDYLDLWIEDYKQNMKYNTIRTYKSIIEKYLKPNLGQYRLSGITSYQLNNFIVYCLDLFDDDFYLEVQPAQSEEQLIVNNKMREIARYYGVKIIVTTDAHYLRKEDREVHKAYLNSKGGEREVDSFYEFAYLQTTEEVIENFQNTNLDYYELEKNTWEIYDKIERYSFHRNQRVPQVEVPNYSKIHSSLGYKVLDSLYESDNPQERYWVNYCVDKLKEIDKFNDTYLSRLEEEADIQKVIGEKLDTCMFAYPIFLQHYINLFWDCGSTVGAGRGSACSGLNHYLLGITQLDPVQWKLPYWR